MRLGETNGIFTEFLKYLRIFLNNSISRCFANVCWRFSCSSCLSVSVLLLILVRLLQDREEITLFSRVGQGTAAAITVLSSHLINLFRVVYEHASLNCRVPSAPRNNDPTISRNYYIANYYDLRGKSHYRRMILVDTSREYHSL